MGYRLVVEDNAFGVADWGGGSSFSGGEPEGCVQITEGSRSSASLASQSTPGCWTSNVRWAGAQPTVKGKGISTSKSQAMVPNWESWVNLS